MSGPTLCRAALLALLPLAAMATPPMPAAPASRTGRFHLAAPCQRAFPLFTALGETQWAEGWHPDLLSGATGRGSVFRTRHPDGQTAVWIVVGYDPAAGRASYARLVEGSNMGLVDVRCTALSVSRSLVEVTYTLTGLDEQGKAFVSRFLSEHHYAAMMAQWQRALSAALASAE